MISLVKRYKGTNSGKKGEASRLAETCPLGQPLDGSWIPGQPLDRSGIVCTPGQPLDGSWIPGQPLNRSGQVWTGLDRSGQVLESWTGWTGLDRSGQEQIVTIGYFGFA